MKKQSIGSKNYLQIINSLLCSEADPTFKRRAKIVLENLKLNDNEKILDIGCGRGFYLKSLSNLNPTLLLNGIDKNINYLKVGKTSLKKNKNIHIEEGDATSLSFCGNYFDEIIASEILEHVSSDSKAISEIFRVLKPGGIALITVPNKDYPFGIDPINYVSERLFNKHVPSNIWWLAGLWADHVRLYSDKEIREKLKKEGFIIEKEWKATHFCFPFLHLILYGIGKNLVEKGLLKSFNRFESNKKRSLANKIILWPIRMIDSLNKENQNNTSCVNLIYKIIKPENNESI